MTGAAGPTASSSFGSGPHLIVSLAGEVHEVVPLKEFSFGRMGDLPIDENPYMHRIVGRFVHRDGLWWLQNLGSRIVLEVADCDSASIHTIKPGVESPLHFAEALVRFHAGRTGYELEVSVEHAGRRALTMPVVSGADTITIADLPMTPDQLRLVLSLAEPSLRDPLSRELRIPSNKQAAHRLGWSLTRFNRKLDNVCEKLTKRGVPGLHGGVSELATDRRRRLVEFALQSGLVAAADLSMLDAPAPTSDTKQP